MARRQLEEEHDNPDRWLVSYADFMTLLFAFFVVMYAISAVNEGKYKVLSDALGSAFGFAGEQNKDARKSKSGTPLSKAHVSEVVHQESSQMTDIANNILQALGSLVKEGKVRVTQTARGVNVEINASLLFAPGDAKLTEESRKALQAIAAVLKNQRNDLEIDGYTDDVPISNPLFPSNWELSAVRAGSVAREFVASGVAENRLMVVGYGSNKPIMPNDTVEGRARNRRVEVVILSSLPEASREISMTTK
ncbi:flagellar motor protein MotD [Sulfuriferula thiophila]|uniref:flagellar motor protein MotD n=1 Tax=Sulfuriferula thiophila TaxID=1781211 RepID=UPI000F60BF45|nr:flagellar motor protein MotD [Sulfuriferula thiophila]